MGATSLFAQKFGRINTQEVISVMLEMKEMQTNIEISGVRIFRRAWRTLSSNTINEALAKPISISTMGPDAVRQLKEKELNDLIQRRNDFEQAAQQDLQKRYNELLAPIIDKAKAAIDKVASAGSYLAVFDT